MFLLLNKMIENITSLSILMGKKQNYSILEENIICKKSEWCVVLNQQDL